MTRWCPTERAAFAALALGAVARASMEYCGGSPGQASTASQLSCTAYPVKRSGFTTGSWCQSTEMFNLAYNPTTKNEALVWQADDASDFWVFHGCDGAGLMNDGSGDSFYLEHFMGTQAPRAPWDCSRYRAGDCQSPWTMDACWCQHWESPFVHPGTSQTYQYWAGMWTTAGSEWPDQLAKKPWFQALVDSGLKSTTAYGHDPADAATAFVIMYPWVCNGPWAGADWSEYWGNDGNWQKGLPFGSLTSSVNCYYDNEPFDIVNKVQGGYDPHSQSTMVPPQFRVYKFVKRRPQDEYIHGWILGEKEQQGGQFRDTTGRESFRLKVRPQGPPY